MNKVWIGWDHREASAYEVCKRSILDTAKRPTFIRPLNVRQLRAMGLYSRAPDPLSSTEFTFTRFLVPQLCNYTGWAVFMDCDIMVRADIQELFDLADETKAVQVVKHDYQPTATTKMGGALQSAYPRKNWSSVVLWNCAHPANKAVTVQAVNEKSGAWLHRFQWLDDGLIGELPVEWNYLVGHNSVRECDAPKAVHFTTGIPGIHPGHDDDEYAAEWLLIADRLNQGAA